MSDIEITSSLSLSVCIVAHNEEDVVGRAVDSVKGWAGQVVVLDCESHDDTSGAAERAGAEVHRGPNGSPEANKNHSFTFARLEWIFILDADELMTDDLKREIEETIARKPSENGFKGPRRNFYFGVPLMHGGKYPDRQLRLFRRGTGRYPAVAMHEIIGIDGAIGTLNTPFDHHPYPTFEVWLRKFDWYTRNEADMLELKGVPITPATIRRYMITTPLRRWIERLYLKRGIRDGVPGVLAATSDLMTKIVSFGRYWERKRRG